MKLQSFVADGKEWFGAVVGDGVVTLNERSASSLRPALAAGELAEMREAVRAKPDHKLTDIQFLPVIPTRKKSCAPASITGRMPPKSAANCPSSPAVRFTNTLVGQGGEIVRPTVSDKFDFEGGLT